LIHEDAPGGLQSQNSQPFTELRVIVIAAAEGDKNSFEMPSQWKNPGLYTARLLWLKIK